MAIKTALSEKISPFLARNAKEGEKTDASNIENGVLPFSIFRLWASAAALSFGMMPTLHAYLKSGFRKKRGFKAFPFGIRRKKL